MRYLISGTILLVVVTFGCQPDPAPQTTGPAAGVVDGIDTLTGLVAEGDYLLVKGNCLACHSAKLITQNRATAEGWREMIRWMQAKQGLADLGPHEDAIVEYLATHYAPQKSGRRAPLEQVEWYELR